MKVWKHGHGEGIVVKAADRRGEYLAYRGWLERRDRDRDVLLLKGVYDGPEQVQQSDRERYKRTQDEGGGEYPKLLLCRRYHANS